MDKIFQLICDLFPHYKVKKNYFYKKSFYFIFCIFRFFLKGPFILNFKDFKIIAFPQKYHYTSFLFTRGNLPDPTELNVIRKNIYKKKSLFIDCGVNFGSYSIPIAASNENCEVFAFDASKLILNEFIKNLKINNFNNIVYKNVAIGEKSGKIFFSENAIRGKNNSSGSGYVITKINNFATDFEIEMISLDDFFKNKNLNKYEIIFIKIDLEGYDINAIYGCKNIIVNNNPIILFEFSKMILKNPLYKHEEFENFILSNNLEILDINKQPINLEKLYQKINQLDKHHETVGNYLLLDKKYREKNLII